MNKNSIAIIATILVAALAICATIFATSGKTESEKEEEAETMVVNNYYDNPPKGVVHKLQIERFSNEEEVKQYDKWGYINVQTEAYESEKAEKIGVNIVIEYANTKDRIFPEEYSYTTEIQEAKVILEGLKSVVSLNEKAPEDHGLYYKFDTENGFRCIANPIMDKGYMLVNTNTNKRLMISTKQVEILIKDLEKAIKSAEDYMNDK